MYIGIQNNILPNKNAFLARNSFINSFSWVPIAPEPGLFPYKFLLTPPPIEIEIERMKFSCCILQLHFITVDLMITNSQDTEFEMILTLLHAQK